MTMFRSFRLFRVLMLWLLIFWPVIHHAFCISNPLANKRSQADSAKSYGLFVKVLQQRSSNGPESSKFTTLQRTSHVLAVSNGGTDALDNGGKNTGDEDTTTTLKAFQGQALLCLVALLYGTLNASLRMVYQLPDPPSAAAMSATRGWLASLCFLPFLAIPSSASTKTKTIAATQDALDRSTTKSTTSCLSSVVWAGLELAIWNGLAQGLLNIGLLSTGSARASFLTQTSVVLTPILSLMAGQRVTKGTWIGCAIALVGLTLLSGVGGGLTSMTFSTGDWLVLGGAWSWSGYLSRLGQIGSRFDEIQLQFVKTLLLAILYSTWFVASVMGGTSGTLIPALSHAMKWAIGPGTLAAWGALLYSALGPGTVADVLQQQGQRHVSASEANVLLSMEPVFAAVCARLVLGEVMTMTETVGGGLILVAAIIAAATGSSSADETDESMRW